MPLRIYVVSPPTRPSIPMMSFSILAISKRICWFYFALLFLQGSSEVAPIFLRYIFGMSSVSVQYVFDHRSTPQVYGKLAVEVSTLTEHLRTFDIAAHTAGNELDILLSQATGVVASTHVVHHGIGQQQVLQHIEQHAGTA